METSMTFKTLIAIAALTALAAPALADPAHVVQDTGHGIVRGAKQIVSGTYHGVAHQVDNVGYAARATGRDVSHGVRHVIHHRRRHRHLRYRHVHRHTVVHH
jgi:hypothetical protein